MLANMTLALTLSAAAAPPTLLPDPVATRHTAIPPATNDARGAITGSIYRRLQDDYTAKHQDGVDEVLQAFAAHARNNQQSATCSILSIAFRRNTGNEGIIDRLEPTYFTSAVVSVAANGTVETPYILRTMRGIPNTWQGSDRALLESQETRLFNNGYFMNYLHFPASPELCTRPERNAKTAPTPD